MELRWRSPPVFYGKGVAWLEGGFSFRVYLLLVMRSHLLLSFLPVLLFVPRLDPLVVVVDADAQGDFNLMLTYDVLVKAFVDFTWSEEFDLFVWLG